MIFTLVMPPVFFLLFGTAEAYKTAVGRPRQRDRLHHGLDGAVRRHDRHDERRRQRLGRARAGLDPPAAADAAAARSPTCSPRSPSRWCMGLAAVIVVGAVGMASGATGDAGASSPTSLALAWVGSVGVRRVRPVHGLPAAVGERHADPRPGRSRCWPSPAACSSRWARACSPTLAKFTPTYGLAELVRAPLTGDGVSIWAVVNVVAWAAVFGFGAAWRFRRDTARV